jgi:YVTN family beta-propeller protein
MPAFPGEGQIRWILALFAGCGAAWCQPSLYVTNQNSNTISVIDTRTAGVTATPSASFSPAGIALSADGSRLFAANPNANLVTMYNTATNAPAGSLSIGQEPMGLATDATRVYVTLHANAALAVYNASTFALQTTLRVGFGPCAVAVASGSGAVYVANTYSSTVTVVDPTRIGTTSSPVIATIAVPASPVALAISPNGVSAWVASSAIPMLTRINLADGAIDTRIPLPIQPAGIAIAPDNSRVYVSGYGPAVTVVNVADGSVGATVNLPACDSPRCVAMGAAVSADGKTLYVANTNLNQVAVLDTDKNVVTSNITVQNAPRAILLGPAPKPAPATSGPY